MRRRKPRPYVPLEGAPEAPRATTRKKRQRRAPDLKSTLHPDFELHGKGCKVVTVTCNEFTDHRAGRSYEATFDAWNRRHGFMCTVCGLELPLDTPLHKIS